MYGATVLTRESACRWLDTFMTNKGVDTIASVFVQDCMIQFSGVASTEQYNYLLKGIQWNALYR